MKNIEFPSHAKINLRLDILKKRPDGYHDIRTIFQKVGLADEVKISIATSGLAVDCDDPQVPHNEGNLAYTAARALLDRYKIKDGLRIAIKKRIPVAAGLGGGSSNAAATLLGINQLFGLGMSRKELMVLGRELGADVPFFIFGNSALATGIGDILEPLAINFILWLLLVTPDIPISTAWAYGQVRRGLTNGTINNTIQPSINRVSEVIALLKNDLEQVVIPRYPAVQTIKEGLLDGGARGALMSGSGSTVFGIFESEAAARAACLRLKAPAHWQLHLTQNLCGYS